jgi:hypothetical protein
MIVRARAVVVVAMAVLLVAGMAPARARSGAELADREGDNTISYSWDAESGRVTQATSGRVFVKGQEVELITSISDEDGRVVMRASLHNLSDETTFYVDGRLKHRIILDGELLRSLKSRPVDRALRPGERIRARFDFRLPSGDYEGRTDYSAD